MLVSNHWRFKHFFNLFFLIIPLLSFKYFFLRVTHKLVILKCIKVLEKFIYLRFTWILLYLIKALFFKKMFPTIEWDVNTYLRPLNPQHFAAYSFQPAFRWSCFEESFLSARKFWVHFCFLKKTIQQTPIYDLNYRIVTVPFQFLRDGSSGIAYFEYLLYSETFLILHLGK